MSKNVLAGLFIVLASGIATWLFLPLAQTPVEVTPIPGTPLVVPIGPIQVNLMLIVLLIAAGTPVAAIVLGLLLSWLGSKVRTDAASATTSASAAPGRKAAAAPAATAEAAVEAELPRAQRLGLLLLMLVAIGATVFFIVQVLPPGFTLF